MLHPSLPTALTFLLGGVFYGDHSVIRPDQFGEDFAALHCITPYQFCCRLSDNPDSLLGAGQWVTPGGSSVEFFGFLNTFFYMYRNPSRVSLSRASSFVPQSGIYQCQIPGADSSVQTLHIGLYPDGEGELVISCFNESYSDLALSLLSGVPHIEPGQIVFNRSALTLTCTSTGGPVRDVVWTRNGQLVSTGYSLSQTVTDTETGMYKNVLRAVDLADLVGNFTCAVSNNRGVSNTMSFLFEGKLLCMYI